MSDDPRVESLKEWNRLARENAENAMVSSMFEALLASGEVFEVFSTWLLVATAAIASFLVANAEKIIPFVGISGFKVLGAFLIASCLFGLVAKGLAVWCKVGRESAMRAKETFAAHFASYQEEERKIRQGATTSGITIETGIRLDRILEEFLRPAPIWVKFFALRHLRTHRTNPQVGYLIALRTYNAQGLFTFLQVLTFLGFLVAGFVLVRPL